MRVRLESHLHRAVGAPKAPPPTESILPTPVRVTYHGRAPIYRTAELCWEVEAHVDTGGWQLPIEGSVGQQAQGGEGAGDADGGASESCGAPIPALWNGMSAPCQEIDGLTIPHRSELLL